MRYNRSCLDPFLRDRHVFLQLSSEEKLSFPHGDLRIAVPDPPTLRERVVETKVGHGGAVPSRTLTLGPHAGTAIVGRMEIERTRTTCAL